VFAPLVPVLGYRAVLVISGHVLNNVAFVAAAAYFYR
jgi:phosphatidylinositol glycan class V